MSGRPVVSILVGFASALLSLGILRGADRDLPDGGEAEGRSRAVEARDALSEIFERAELDGDALDGLVEKFPQFFEWRSGEGSGSAEALVVEEWKGIVYLRPGSMSVEEAGRAGKLLRDFEQRGASGLVLDLRLAGLNGGAKEAARWLDLFLPAPVVAFRIRGAKGGLSPVRSLSEPSWNGALVTLVDSDTGSIEEIMAGALLAKVATPVFGASTAGRAALFAEVELEDGRVFRYAAADVTDSAGEPIWGRAIDPHFAIELDRRKKEAAQKRIGELGLAAVVAEPVRPRRNEAALIAGTDPELPYLIAQSAKDGDSGEGVSAVDPPGIEDPVLRAAMDMFLAAGSVGLKEKVEHVKRREWRLEETRRGLEELKRRELEKSQGKAARDEGGEKSGEDDLNAP